MGSLLQLFISKVVLGLKNIDRQLLRFSFYFAQIDFVSYDSFRLSTMLILY